MQHRIRGKTTQYLVRWKGYGPGDNSWLPEKELTHAKKLVNEYKKLGYAPVRVMEETLPTDHLQIELMPGATTPTRGSAAAAGYDLYANATLTIPAKQRSTVPTGIKLKLPTGTYGRIAPRSGLSLKRLDIAAGVIDRDYTGEIQVLLVNNSDFDFVVTTGDRIAQLVLERIAEVDLEIVDTIGTSARGEKGFGSTGK